MSEVSDNLFGKELLEVAREMLLELKGIRGEIELLRGSFDGRMDVFSPDLLNEVNDINSGVGMVIDSLDKASSAVPGDEIRSLLSLILSVLERGLPSK